MRRDTAKKPAILRMVGRPLAALWLIGLPLIAAGEETSSPPEQSERTAGGVLPSLSFLLPPDSPLRLRFPDAIEIESDDTAYDRRFPLGAQAAIDRGVTLPKPWGISFSHVTNNQAQSIENLAVALGKGAPPPQGSELVDLPFVSIQNASSRTTTKQIRADLWVLPFLNIFGGIGAVSGNVPLDVVVDLDQTGLCPPIVTCGSVGASFNASVETNTATLGLVGAYGWDNWFVSGSASSTLSFGGKTEEAVQSHTVSGRFGRRWAFGPGHVVAPFVGVSYLDLDQVVEGVTGLQDAFPDGDSLDVRYRARISNTNKWSGIIGLNLGFVQGFSLSAEYNFNKDDERTVLSGTYRF